MKVEYEVNKWIFRGGVILMIAVWFLVIATTSNSFPFKNNIYVNCPNTSISKCENPLFNNTKYCGSLLNTSSVLCTQEFLPKGFEYGTKPNLLYKDFGLITIGIILCCLALNHYLYNKGYFNKRRMF